MYTCPRTGQKCYLCQNASSVKLQEADSHCFFNNSDYKTLNKNISVLCKKSDLTIPINPARIDECSLNIGETLMRSDAKYHTQLFLYVM